MSQNQSGLFASKQFIPFMSITTGIALVIAIIGLVFIELHFPGGHGFLFCGVTLTGLICLLWLGHIPSVTSSLKEKEKQKGNPKSIKSLDLLISICYVMLISFVAVCIGIAFKMLHLSSWTIVFFAGALSLCISMLFALYLYFEYKSYDDEWKSKHSTTLHHRYAAVVLSMAVGACLFAIVGTIISLSNYVSSTERIVTGQVPENDKLPFRLVDAEGATTLVSDAQLWGLYNPADEAMIVPAVYDSASLTAYENGYYQFKGYADKDGAHAVTYYFLDNSGRVALQGELAYNDNQIADISFFNKEIVVACVAQKLSDGGFSYYDWEDALKTADYFYIDGSPMSDRTLRLCRYENRYIGYLALLGMLIGLIIACWCLPDKWRLFNHKGGEEK